MVTEPPVTMVVTSVIRNNATTQYLPFYGGGKGQYLEIKKDTIGTVLSEKIVPEEKISSENIIKNSEENLLAKVLAANFQNLRSTSGNALNLLNTGRKKGFLNNAEKTRFKSQLSNLGDVASNTIKLIEELSDNLDVLFKKNESRLRQYPENYDDDVGEEGVGIDNPTETDVGYNSGDTIAEAKPIGLAVIAEHGLAAARPMGTAIAISGVALARPIGTAIAGVDPSLLGINFQVNQSKRSTNTKS